MKNTSWLAILLAAIAGMAIGFLWYGTLFQDTWMTGNNITANEDMTSMFKNGVEVPVTFTPMLVNTVGMFVYALFMNWLINKTGDTSLQGGLTLGASLGAIIFLIVIIADLFAANPTSLSMVDGSYNFVLFSAMGAIIGGLRKK